MRPLYREVNIGGIYDKINEIPNMKNQYFRIHLWSIQELLKLYPDNVLQGDYVIFNDGSYLNYKNYMLIQERAIEKNGDFSLLRYFPKSSFIHGNSSNGFCYFLKYPFEDPYIDSGIYIYTYMIKKITRFQLRTRGVTTSTLISGDILFNVSIVKESSWTENIERIPVVTENVNSLDGSGTFSLNL